MFEAPRKEWTELLALLRLLNTSSLSCADTRGRASDAHHTLDYVQRLESNGTRTYRRSPEGIVISTDAEGGHAPILVDFEMWEQATAHAFELLRAANDDNFVLVSDEMEAWLDEIQMLSIGGTGEGQHHLLLALDGAAPQLATLLSRAGGVPTRLLDGGRTANIKLEQTGTRFAAPMAAKVNYLESEETVRDRMLLVERMGSSLKYHNVADRVFRANLALIDLHLGRLLCEMLRFSYLENVLRMDELLAALRVLNPLKVSTELIEKHRYYEHQLSRLLLACLAGMRPGKIYRGETSLSPYVLLLQPDSQIVMFDGKDRETLANFLLHNTRLERGAMEKDKYGSLERENNVYYFKLNLKIALTKR